MIHPMAVVDPSAQVDPEAEVGPFCVVKEKAQIGPRTCLMERVTVGPHTTLGCDNLVYPGAVIGGDPQDLSYRLTDLVACQIGDRNVFRECVTVNRGTLKDTAKTVIGDDNLFMAYSHIAHDCLINNQTVIANGVQLAGHATIEKGVVISGLTGVNQFVTVGRLAYVAGMTAVFQDIPPFVKVQGERGEVRGLNTLGLKRFGMSQESLFALREAYRIIWLNDLTLKEAIEEIQKMSSRSEEVDELVKFLELKSQGRFGRARENTRSW